MQELLGSARKLLIGTPTEGDVRRAVSTTYYALYHHLSRRCCELLVGDETLGSADYQVYRALEHGLMNAACNECATPGKGFPAAVVEYARTFSWLQGRRLAADYDPTAQFNPLAAERMISIAEAAMAGFDAAPERHQLAFAVLVAVRRRGRG